MEVGWVVLIPREAAGWARTTKLAIAMQRVPMPAVNAICKLLSDNLHKAQLGLNFIKSYLLVTEIPHLQVAFKLVWVAAETINFKCCLHGKHVCIGIHVIQDGFKVNHLQWK